MNSSSLPSLSLQASLLEVLDSAIEITNADFGNVQLFDPEQSCLTIVAHRGFPDWWIDFWNDAGKGLGACGKALESKVRIIIEDVQKSPVFMNTPALDIQRRAGVRAIQSTPILSRTGELLGMFSTHYRSPCRPDESQLKLLDMISRHAAAIIEMAHSEAALREREERLRRVSDNASVGLTRCNRDWFYLSANPAYAEIAGKPLDQIVGRPLVEVMGAEAAETIRPYVERALRGEYVTHEIQVPFASAGSRHLHVSYTPDADAAGHIVGWVACVTDITERKQMEEALRQGQERFSLAMQGANDGLWDWDMTTDRVYYSPRWKSILGYEEHEVGTGLEEWVDRLHPEDRDRALAQAADCRDGRKKSYEIEFRMRHKDGHYVDILSRGFGACDAAGKIVRTVGIHVDITNRRQTEEKLRESEEKFRAIANYTIDWESWIGPEGNLLWMNPAVEQFTGYTPEEIMAMPDFVATVIAEPDLPLLTALFSKTERRHRGENIELRYLHRSGQQRWLAASWQPIFDARGNSLGTRVSCRDITERKQAEEELRKSQEEINILSGLLPICAQCKKIRNDKGYWEVLEAFIAKHSEAQFSHGICPECAKKLYPEIYDSIYPSIHNTTNS